MTNCHDAREALADLVFGELSDEAVARLNEHLHGCDACRAYERELLALRAGVRGTPSAPAAALRERVRGTLAASRPAPVPPWRRPVPAWGAVAAVLACVAAALVLARLPRHVPDVAEELRDVKGVPLGDAPVHFRFAEAFDTGVRGAPVAEGSVRERAAHPRSDTL